jgi:hypothetical protein
VKRVALLCALVLGACKVEPAPRVPIVDATFYDAAVPPMRPSAVEIDGKRRLVLPAHNRAELIDRRLQLAKALPVLTPEERTRVLPRMDVIACVSIAEGGFDGIATHAGDPMASIGIFQWAGERKQPITAGSSLERFFQQMQASAKCDHCTARDAWQALTDAGITLDRGVTKLRGTPATGAMLEEALRPVISNPAVQAYQLIAAVDWIDRIAQAPVAGISAVPLGSTLSDRGLCTVMLLAVNRPAWVAPALHEAGLDVLGGESEDQRIDAFRIAALKRYPDKERLARAARLLTSETLRP